MGEAVNRWEEKAEKIVDHLFTNGASDKAARLVLEWPGGGSSGYGWARGPVRNLIAAALKAEAERVWEEAEKVIIEQRVYDASTYLAACLCAAREKEQKP